MLVTTQGGTVRVVVNGSLLPTPALSLSLCASGEQGLLGSAVSPTNQVFLYYTSSHDSECWNRVSRFTLGANNLLTGEVVLLDWIPTPATNHNAGDLNIGPDGKLYVSVGDGGCQLSGLGCAGSNDNARFRTHLLGKILRLNLDGTVPVDNPFAGANTRRCGHPAGDTNPGSAAFCSETWAWGLRNPFRFAFRADGLMHINDVGQGAREEVDVGAAGADYGWNCREGKIANPAIAGGCTLPSATEPIHDYASSTGCRSITGAAFIPAGAWSSGLRRPLPVRRLHLRQDLPARRHDGPGLRHRPGRVERRPHGVRAGPVALLHHLRRRRRGAEDLLRGRTARPAGRLRRRRAQRHRRVPSRRTGSGTSPAAAAAAPSSTGDRPATSPRRPTYDGDDKTDLAVFRPSTGVWYVQRSTAGHDGPQLGRQRRPAHARPTTTATARPTSPSTGRRPASGTCPAAAGGTTVGQLGHRRATSPRRATSTATARPTWPSSARRPAPGTSNAAAGGRPR